MPSLQSGPLLVLGLSSDTGQQFAVLCTIHVLCLPTSAAWGGGSVFTWEGLSWQEQGMDRRNPDVAGPLVARLWLF